MATPNNKLRSVLGVAKEVTEGTYVAPTAFLLPLPAFSLTPAKEPLVRDVIRADIGLVTPRTGLESVTASVPLELKASGVEGDKPESDLFLESALGSVRQLAAQNTTRAGVNTSTNLLIEAADIGDYTVGDMFIILESGDHHIAFVTAVDPSGGSENIDFLPPASFTPSSGVVLSKSTTYFQAATGHPSLSFTTFWADEIDERAVGCKVDTLSIDNFSTGQLAALTFGLQGMKFARVDGSSSSPTFSPGIPPIILNACLYQNSTLLSLNDFAMTLTNEIAKQNDFCDENGTVAQRVKSRSITGSFNPYMDDTTFGQFTNFDNTTEYSLILTVGNPSAVSGELDLGSAWGIYLPQVVTTAVPIGDVDDLLTDNVEFQATQGSSGTSEDIFMGFV